MAASAVLIAWQGKDTQMCRKSERGVRQLEKRRVRLEINGIVCGLITEESDEYMQRISDDVGEMMRKIIAASPFITREAAALTVALSYRDEAKKGDERLNQMNRRVHEMEKKMLEAQREAAQLRKENTQLWEETSTLMDQPAVQGDLIQDEYQKRITDLEAENELLRQARTAENQASQSAAVMRTKPVKLKNPLRHDEYEQQGLVSFFEKKHRAEENEAEDVAAHEESDEH